jgi:serine protease Do
MMDFGKVIKHKIALHGLDYKGWGWVVSPSLIIFPGSILSGFSEVRVLTPDGPRISSLVVLDKPNGLGCLKLEDSLPLLEPVIALGEGSAKAYMNSLAEFGELINSEGNLEPNQYYWGFNEAGDLIDYSWIQNGILHQVELVEWLKPIFRFQEGEEVPWVQERVLEMPYRPTGIPLLIEEVIEAMGHTPGYCRNGRRAWLCESGSAKMSLSYHEDPAILTIELRLVGIGPATRLRDLMIFLLRQNYSLPGYNFGIHQNAVFIALEIPARFLSPENMGSFLRSLLLLSDQYDNQLVDQYKAVW